MDFSSIQDIDFQILQWFNGSNNVILDQLVMALTSGFTWIPLYLVLFIIVMRNNETIGQIGLLRIPVHPFCRWHCRGNHQTACGQMATFQRSAGKIFRTGSG